jgi:hypothetical protein
VLLPAASAFHKGVLVRFKVLFVASVLLAALAFAASAAADTPANSPAPVVVGRFDFTNEFLGDTSLCGFPVDWSIHSRGSFRFFPTDQGHEMTNVVTGKVDYRFSANGKVVSAAVRLAETIFPSKAFPDLDAVLTMHGLAISIRLFGGGLVIRDAGLLVELPDGTAAIIRGPHPVRESGGVPFAIATICAQLA